MSFTEVMNGLPSLTVAERQSLVRRALELDEPGLTPEEDALVAKRLADHRRHPETAVTPDEMKARLRLRLAK